MDLHLGAADGFVSSDGWDPEEVLQGRKSAVNTSGIVLFSARPFKIVPYWFQGEVCQRACKDRLLKCEADEKADAVSSACGLLDDQDTMLTHVLRRTFGLRRAPDRRAIDAKPRLLQVGPSGCATTAIATIFTSLHRLRVAKSYVGSIEIRDWMKKAMAEGLPPLYYVNRFDVITDTFDIIRQGIFVCTDDVGPGGERCDKVENGVVEKRLHEFKTMLQAVHVAYPNAWFLLNTRTLNDWIAKRVHNCWRHLAEPVTQWEQWINIWDGCCAATHGIGGNQVCWHGEAGAQVQANLPAHLAVKSFGYAICCDGLKVYVEAWQDMHYIVNEVARDRTVNFHITRTPPRILSESLGLGDRHDDSYWRRVHAGNDAAALPMN